MDVGLLDADRVVCVYWAGAVRVWSRGVKDFVYSYQFPEADWRPDLGASALRISPACEVAGIRNISGTFKKFLGQIP